MKNPKNLFVAGISLGVLCAQVPLILNQKLNKAEAAGRIVETYAYNDMVGAVSGYHGNDVTPENSGNVLVSYGFRHGDVAKSSIEKFSDTVTNRLGVFSDSNPVNASFVNWRMVTSNNDGGIIMFTAHQKSTLNVSRKRLGGDWLDGIQLSMYKNNTLLKSITLSDGVTTPDDFSYTVTLEENDTFYWQILNTQNTNRHISLNNTGAADWSTLPTFTVSEYLEAQTVTLSKADMVNAMNTSNGEASVIDGLGSYQVRVGSILNGSDISSTHSESQVGNDDAYMDSDSIFCSNQNGIVIKFTASKDVVFEMINDTVYKAYEHAAVRAYQYSAGANLTKKLYEFTNFTFYPEKELSGKFILSTGDILYLEFATLTDEEVDFTNLNSIKISQMLDSVKSDYPLYTPTNYQEQTSFTHKEIAFESARLKGEAFTSKDAKISLLGGIVSIDRTDLHKFEYIEYDDGEYVETTKTPRMFMSGKDSSFDGEGYASVQDYRLKTSSSEYVVYQFVATKNTHLTVSHDATNGGWIDVAGKTFMGAYQSDGTKTVEVMNKEITSATNAKDTFGVSFDLKEGDIAYYVFGCTVATQRNLNIAPNFAFDNTAYNSNAREEMMGSGIVEAYLYSAVTDIINNDHQPVTYSEILTVQLGHGSVKDIQDYAAHKGDGTGTAEDALITGNGNDSDSQFKRWQFHAGTLNDDAIIRFTAEKDTMFTLSHEAVAILYSNGASIKYYIQDTDGFLEFKDERYVVYDTPKDFYGYTAHLSKGQSLILDFTANDENGYAVVGLEWQAFAATKDYDPSLVNDFTAARTLQAYKDSKVQALTDYVNGLDSTKYSTSNFATIETTLTKFISDVEVATTTEAIDVLYSDALNKIKAVKTIAQEEQEIQDAIDAAKAEARAYMDAHKGEFKKKEWQDAEALYAEFVTKISTLVSKTDISIKLQEFKNAFDALPRGKGGCQSSIVYPSLIVCATSFVAACALLMIRKQTKKHE